MSHVNVLYYHLNAFKGRRGKLPLLYNELSVFGEGRRVVGVPESPISDLMGLIYGALETRVYIVPPMFLCHQFLSVRIDNAIFWFVAFRARCTSQPMRRDS